MTKGQAGLLCSSLGECDRSWVFNYAANKHLSSFEPYENNIVRITAFLREWADALEGKE